MSAFDIGEMTGREVSELEVELAGWCVPQLQSGCSFLPLIEMFHYTEQEIQRKLESPLQIEHSAVAQHIVSLVIVGGDLSKIN